MKKPKEFVLVMWEDPASEFDGWQDVAKMAATPLDLVFSVGWPVREDDTHLYIALDWSDESCHTIGKIPKHAIEARKVVQLRGFPPRESSKVSQKLAQKEQNDVDGA